MKLHFDSFNISNDGKIATEDEIKSLNLPLEAETRNFSAKQSISNQSVRDGVLIHALAQRLQRSIRNKILF